MFNILDGNYQKEIGPWQQMMTMVMEQVYLMSSLVRAHFHCLSKFNYKIIYLLLLKTVITNFFSSQINELTQ